MAQSLADLIMDYTDAVANHDAAHDKAGPTAWAEADIMLAEARQKLNERLLTMGEQPLD